MSSPVLTMSREPRRIHDVVEAEQQLRRADAAGQAVIVRSVGSSSWESKMPAESGATPRSHRRRQVTQALRERAKTTKSPRE